MTKNVNLGKWETTINKALENYAIKHNYKATLTQYFKMSIEIENNNYVIENYKIVNDEIIATLKRVENERKK